MPGASLGHLDEAPGMIETKMSVPVEPPVLMFSSAACLASLLGMEATARVSEAKPAGE